MTSLIKLEITKEPCIDDECLIELIKSSRNKIQVYQQGRLKALWGLKELF